MTMKLSPEATAKLAQIDHARQAVHQKLDIIAQTQESMLGSGWHGTSATKYGNKTTELQEIINGVLKDLDSVADTAHDHIIELATADHGGN